MSSQLPFPYTINIHISPRDNSQVTLHNNFSFNFKQPTQHNTLVEEELTETEYRISEDGEPIDIIRSRSVTRPNSQTHTLPYQEVHTQTPHMSQVHASTNTHVTQPSTISNNIPVSQNIVPPNTEPIIQTTTSTLPETNVTPGNASIHPGLFGNRRVNFHNPNNNSQSTVELFTFAPTNGNNVNPNDFTNQLNNMTNGLINLFSGNSNANMPNISGTSSGRSGGLNLNDLRQYTTLSIYNEPNNNNVNTNEGTNEDTITTTCEICHDTINNGDIIRIINICNHSFHQECIDAWLENNNTCPYCRGNVLDQTPIDVHSETIDGPGNVNTTSENINSNDNDNDNDNEHTPEI